MCARERLEALLAPDLVEPRVVLARELDEEVELRAVVVEDRAVREADLAARAAARSRRRSPSARSSAARRRGSAPRRASTCSGLTFGMSVTLQRRISILLFCACLATARCSPSSSPRFVSLTGTNMTTVALPWFVLATTGSTAKMGLVLACETLPAFALGIPGGSVVAAARRAAVARARRRCCARPARRRPGPAREPAPSPSPLLLVLVTAIGVFSVPYAAAASSLLPEIVGEDEHEVARAQAALQVAIQVTGIVGPVAAGVLIPLLGAPQLLYRRRRELRALGADRRRARARRDGRLPAPSRRRGVLAGVRHVFADSLLASIVTVGADRARRPRGALRVAAGARVPATSTTRAPPACSSPPTRSARSWAACSRCGSRGA